MLKLKKICKSYKTGDFFQQVLKDVDLEFRKNEFVSILGPSGSGKTTLLNIIGGLDRYDKGDLIINGKSTKKFKDKDWDAYRNNCIGFVFQSYNLISHISILSNVEMSMTLSGVSRKERRKKALEALDKVGLKDHANKKPNQLSGGQMQRVAIARAIVNDPDIILADEPTGALDSKTSKQIMELIKELSKDKLVIMVTHNAELAKEYSTRIVEFKDGNLLNDSNPITNEKEKNDKFNIKKTSMNFFTALNLSFNNITTKKGRTLLTAFASSIGIIGIALILSLSNGFDIQIDIFEKETLSSLPIMISKTSMEMDEDAMLTMTGQNDELESYTEKEVVYPLDPVTETITHKNIFTEEYINYINDIDPKLVSGISYYRTTALNILNYSNDKYNIVNTTNFSAIPVNIDSDGVSIMESNYDVIYGTMPSKYNEVVLLVDSKNRLDSKLLESLGYDTSKENISFEDLINKEVKLILNNDYYKNLGDYYTFNQDYDSMYNSENSITLKITGIIRGKDTNKLTTTTSGILYTNDLLDYVIEKNNESEIVKKQKEVDYNVLTGEKFTNDETGLETKDNTLSYLGADTYPMMINIYPKDFDTKEKIIKYLDDYNNKQDEGNKVVYTDLASTISSLSSDIMNAITIVLIAFSAISLVVSSIMIGIITYISVLERTKEIGILRALGARKKDITRVFNAETFIIGLCSGLIGIIITYILLIPTNIILENITDLANIARLNPIHAFILIIISLILTLIGGFIPATMASKKDPVIALRTE